MQNCMHLHAELHAPPCRIACTSMQNCMHLHDHESHNLQQQQQRQQQSSTSTTMNDGRETTQKQAEQKM